MRVLCVQFSRHICIEGLEAFLRSSRLATARYPVDLILHTPVGMVLAAKQIAKSLVSRRFQIFNPLKLYPERVSVHQDSLTGIFVREG
jgi:serine dehydrogenase proteinase